MKIRNVITCIIFVTAGVTLLLAPNPLFSQWNQWRGPNRAANTAMLPESLDKVPILLWERKLQGDGLSGIVATENLVVVADRDTTDTKDFFRCYAAETGDTLWTFEYFAPGQIDRDYGSAPRATPLIHGNKIYILGGFGHLHCLELVSGKLLWKKELTLQFSAKMPKWGYCGSPLFVAKNPDITASRDKIIVQPGGQKTQLVAFDPETGEPIWASSDAKRETAYSSPILAEFSGKRQIISYDIESLGGWDPETGQRLWEMVPPRKGDFNVPTPVIVGDKLLLSSENNGTRLYRFDSQGKIVQEPDASNRNLSPDTSTPVFLEGKVYGINGELLMLDAENNLKTVARVDDEAFYEYCTLIAGKTRAGKKRLLVTSSTGEIVLLDIDDVTPKILGRIGAREGNGTTVAHTALQGRRLYVRTVSELLCYLLDE